MAKDVQPNFDLGADPNQGTPAKGVSAANDADALVFDLDNVEQPTNDVIPKGSYKAIVESFEYTQSAAGNPMLVTTYSIVEGEHTDRKVWDYLVLTGEGAKFSLPRLKQMLQSMCPEIPMAGFNPAKFAEAGTIINRVCTIKVKIQKQKKGEYVGTYSNRVDAVLPATEVGDFM